MHNARARGAAQFGSATPGPGEPMPFQPKRPAEKHAASDTLLLPGAGREAAKAEARKAHSFAVGEKLHMPGVPEPQQKPPLFNRTMVYKLEGERVPTVQRVALGPLLVNSWTRAH